MRHQSFCLFISVVMLVMCLPALWVGAHLAVYVDSFFVLPLPMMVCMAVSWYALESAERA